MINLFAVHMPESVDEPLLEVLHSGYVGQGPKVDEFEKRLGERFDTPFVLTLNSATSGLQLALHLAGARPGTTVVSTPQTCSATNTAVLATHADIIWADVDPRTGLIDPVDVERKLQPNTVAVMAVDWGGLPCDYDRLMALRDEYGVKIIDDAAHAIGSLYKNRELPGIADFCVLSLQAIKHITTVDGGVLFCSNVVDHERAKLLRWYGIDREGSTASSRCEEDILEPGFKYHMNDVCATIGIEQLKWIDSILEKHRDNAAFFNAELDEYFMRPCVAYSASSAYWLYSILLPNERDRLEFQRYMLENDVTVSRVHVRNDRYTCFAGNATTRLPGVEQFSKRQVSIPVHWKLSGAERDTIVGLCNRFARQAAPAVATARGDERRLVT
jgi:dTDP-4-amino-4,6-dideoxygalactose transaminase